MQATLTCRLPEDSEDSRAVDLVADNHSGRLPFITCVGVVVDITMTDHIGTPQPIQRLPSRRALSGNDDFEDGTIRSAVSGHPVDQYGRSRVYVTMSSTVLSEIDEAAWSAATNPMPE